MQSSCCIDNVHLSDRLSVVSDYLLCQSICCVCLSVNILVFASISRKLYSFKLYMLVIIVKNLSNEVVFDDIDLWPWVHGNPEIQS